MNEHFLQLLALSCPQGVFLQSSESENFTLSISFKVLKPLIVVSLKDALSGVPTDVFSDNALSTSALPLCKTNAFFKTLVEDGYFGL